jgi:predicted ATPase/DNA-binding XRE family transcriptional regulator
MGGEDGHIFGDLVRRQRKAAGLTQEELAERAGIAPETVSALERGINRAPHRDTLQALADALQLAPEERAALLRAARRGGMPTAPPPPPNTGEVTPAGAPLVAAVQAQANLPVPPTPLVGRAQEVRALTALLRRETVRLVTLTGTGGTGKTRLGQQVAADLVDDFPDGVWFVRLSRLTDPALVLPTIAQTLGMRGLGSRPLDERLRAYLREKTLLLLLDNFEQLTLAAPSVGALLEECPRLKVLVTSRVVLRLRGERQYQVLPLALPPAPPPQPPAYPRSVEELAHYAAVALFLQRAQEAKPDFQVTAENAAVVAKICARLDGLPLAIELAAARIKLLPPQQLLQRIERRLPLLTGGAQDLLERQQTMRATLAWSEDLLQPAERVLFHRLAVFVTMGGCTLEAAEAVCAAPEGAEPLATDVLDGLGRLVDQSLVQQREEAGEARFGLLQVVREYALERLEASGEGEALRRAHATYYLRLAEAAEPGLLGREVRSWVARLAPELDNLRTALGWARDHRELELGLRAMRAFREFRFSCEDEREAWRWLEELLTLALPAGPSDEAIAAAIRAGLPGPVLATTLHEAGAVANLKGEYGKAEHLLQHSLALYRRLGDRAGEGHVLFDLAISTANQGNLEGCVPLYEASLAILREVSDPWWLTYVLGSFAYHLYTRGDLDRAEALLEEALPLARALDNPVRLSFVLINSGEIARVRGDWRRSLAFEREALALAKSIGANYYIAEALAEIGLALGTHGLSEGGESLQVLRAARLLATATSLFERTVMRKAGIPSIVGFERGVAAVRTVLGDAAFTVAWNAGLALSLEEAIAEALNDEPKG